MPEEPSTIGSFHSAANKSGRRSFSTTSRDPIAQLRPYDILSGRSWEARNNIGNRRFRVTIEMNLSAYQTAPNKINRSVLIDSLVRMLRDDIGARFLKNEGDHYVELGEKDARKKVAHALRDMSRMAQKQHESLIRMERKVSKAAAMTWEDLNTKLNTTPSRPENDSLSDGFIPSLRHQQEPMKDQSLEDDLYGWLSNFMS